MSNRSPATIAAREKSSVIPMRSSLIQRKCACGNSAGMAGECSDCQKKLLVQGQVSDRSNTSEISPIVHELLPIQTKLTVGKPGDIYEQEADLMENQMMQTELIQHPISHEITGVDAISGIEDSKVNFGMPDLETLENNLSGSPNACIVNAALPYARSGILRFSTGKVGEQFEVRVEWGNASIRGANSSYCAAECGEYHQFIKGHMLVGSNKDGSKLDDISLKIFGGLTIDENIFREDGSDRNPNGRYGHRRESQTMDESFIPDRITGTKYIGRDFPSVNIGAFADIDLTFLGKLVDTCNGTELLSGSWQVQYKGIIRP
jgi:hypothetical protein